MELDGAQGTLEVLASRIAAPPVLPKPDAAIVKSIAAQITGLAKQPAVPEAQLFAGGKTLCAVERINNEEKVKYIEEDLVRLDSLKVIYNKFLSSSKISATVYNDAIDPSKLFAQSSTLLTDLQEARRKLYTESTAIQIIDPIKIANKTRSKSLAELLVILGLSGMFVGFLMGLMVETRKRLLP